MVKLVRCAIAGDGLCIGPTDKDQPFLCIHPKMMSCRSLAETRGEEIGKHPTLPKVQFSSIHTNHDAISAPHTDSKPMGCPSIAMGLRDFEGGRLKAEGHAPVSICGRVVVFDGQTTHSSSSSTEIVVLRVLHACLLGIGVGELGWPYTRLGLGVS
jgi:hypothetical protein